MKPLAERGRFELPEPVKAQRFSRPPHSTTLPPLRDETTIVAYLGGCPKNEEPTEP